MSTATRASRHWSTAMLAVAAVAAACSADRSTPVQPEPQESSSTVVALSVGESAEVGGRAVTLIDVREDSRCPSGVQCAWAGDAAVELRVDGGGEPAVIVLHTTLEPRSTAAAGLRLTLLRLEPQPRAGEPIPVGDYEASLRIEAG